MLEYLQEKFTNIDGDLGLSQRGQVKVLCSMIRSDLEQALQWCYWGDEEHYYSVTRKQLSGVLPFPLSLVLPYFSRKSALNRLSVQGIDSEDKARQAAKSGYKALSGLLGDKLWLLGGDRPTTADVLLFGHLMDALLEPINEQLKEHPNLLRFCDRVRSDYFENPAYESEALVSQNSQNYFESLRGFKLVAREVPLPIPTASKRVAKSNLQEDLDELGKRKTKEEKEEEEEIARGNRNSIIAAVVVVAAYFVGNVVSFSFEDDDDEDDEDFYE